MITTDRVMDDDGLIDSGSRCSSGHPIWLVSEGYGLCTASPPRGSLGWYAWRFTAPATTEWYSSFVTGRDGQYIEAWTRWWGNAGFASKKGARAFIQRDMDAHRALPYDEERERARLMEVAR